MAPLLDERVRRLRAAAESSMAGTRWCWPRRAWPGRRLPMAGASGRRRGHNDAHSRRRRGAPQIGEAQPYFHSGLYYEQVP